MRTQNWLRISKTKKVRKDNYQTWTKQKKKAEVKLLYYFNQAWNSKRKFSFKAVAAETYLMLLAQPL